MSMRIMVAVLMLCEFPASLRAADELQSQLNLMKEQIDRLTRMLEAQQKTIQEQQNRLDTQDKQLMAVASTGKPLGRPTDDLWAQIQKVKSQAAEAIAIAGRKKPNDLNMSIGAAVDTSYRYFDGPRTGADRPAGNDFSLRGAELIFYADVDPNFKSYLVLNATGDAENNDEATPSVEEAAICTTALPHAQIKGGRFFAPFGRLSMIHEHDLPFVTRPRSIDTYVGGESGGDGVQVQALLPLDHFVQITGGAFNKVGADSPLLDPAGSRRNGAELTYFLKALTSFDFGDSHTLEVGGSALERPAHLDRRNLLDLELTYKWHPSGQPLREKLIWGAELLRNEMRQAYLSNPDDVDAGADPIFKRNDRSGWGGYTYLEYFYNPHWSFGPRVDLFQTVDPQEKTRRTYDQTYSLFLTYKFSEFTRLRLEASRHEFLDGNSANEFYLQWTAFWGAHTHNFDQR